MDLLDIIAVLTFVVLVIREAISTISTRQQMEHRRIQIELDQLKLEKQRILQNCEKFDPYDE